MNQLPAGQALFDVVRPLGSGGLGTVDEIIITASNAPDLPVGMLLARKRLNGAFRADPTARERFEREISAIAGMAHPNVIKCSAQNIDRGPERFYVMPVYANSVRRCIHEGSMTGDWSQIARQGVIIARALAYAHSLGHIHRDIKPDNLLYNNGGPIQVADWGCGYFIHKHSRVLMPLTNGALGTAYYCSWEQWSTGKCGPSGDVYSLGMTLDEWTCGRRRNLGPLDIGNGVRTPTTTELTTGARKFNAVVQAMTARDTRVRIATMTDVASLLEAAISQG